MQNQQMQTAGKGISDVKSAGAELADEATAGRTPQIIRKPGGLGKIRFRTMKYLCGASLHGDRGRAGCAEKRIISGISIMTHNQKIIWDNTMPQS